MRGRVVRREEVDAKIRQQMFCLLKQHFSGVEMKVFEQDLDEKNWVILIENKAGQLVGFSTILCYHTHYKGESLWVVYSGDTIMDPSAWRSFALSRIWIKTIQQICPSTSQEHIVWLLISSGYRSYRFLPVYWQQFYPNYERETPDHIKGLMKYIATERFGEFYDPAAGIVRFPKPQSLNGQLATIPKGKLSDPHVRHFITLNPDYKNGDELVCLTFLSDDNLTPTGKRMITAAHQEQTVS